MSNSIEVKQLRNEVQLLRDELAIMKRKYEDILYNLDDDNFSSRIVREKGNMKTAIEVNAEGIKTKVSNAEFQSAMTLTAEKIETDVSNLDKTLSSEISQTATAIRQEVANVETGLSTKITQAANEIELSVSALDSEISSLSITTDGIVSQVEDLENFKTSIFTQTADGFTLDGYQTTFTGVVFITDNDGNKAFSIFLNEGSYDSFHLWGYGSYDRAPLILGNEYGAGAYIGNYSENQQIATHDWVREYVAEL